jgi:hypothetical protein|tara:strand:- start:37 stop:426 length:390 start_codon:yes stop_codon:yes gene_type:complete
MAEYYKYNEIKEYFDDFMQEQDDDWILENKEDIHHYVFNNDYYIIGTYKCKKWLGDKLFDVIDIIQEYENLHFGEVSTDLSNPEAIVNMYTYIVGEEIIGNTDIEQYVLNQEIKEIVRNGMSREIKCNI